MMNNTQAAPEHTVSSAKAQFPGSDGQTYVNVSARGLLPACARQAIDELLDARMAGGDKEYMFEIVARARRKFAKHIGAHEDEIAITKNISDGLNAIAAAIPWRKGDKVILCSALEHPNNVYPWLLQAMRHGVELVDVPPDGRAMPVRRMTELVDARTRVVTLSTVTFGTGYRSSTALLSEACRAVGTILLVDAAQSAGILQTDVSREGIDALVTSTQKGLLGLYGMGFLYCRRKYAEQLVPATLARFGVDVEAEHEAAMGSKDFTFAKGARRFDLGNYNFIAAAAVERSLDLIDSVRVGNIEHHVCALAERLTAGLQEIGLDTNETGETMAHIVTVGEPGEIHDKTGNPLLNALYQHLVENKVNLSIRKGQLRFSMHMYNTSDDIERILDLTAGFPSLSELKR
ncbi:MAG: aminotransferase class V-fold PLP-dependent enzyme [Rhodospirillales bacterium]